MQYRVIRAEGLQRVPMCENRKESRRFPLESQSRIIFSGGFCCSKSILRSLVVWSKSMSRLPLSWKLPSGLSFLCAWGLLWVLGLSRSRWFSAVGRMCGFSGAVWGVSWWVCSRMGFSHWTSLVILGRPLLFCVVVAFIGVSRNFSLI